jgi:hypothetical protein
MNRLCAAVFALLSVAQLSYADSKSLETAKSELRAIKDAGRTPGFVDFVNLLNREDLQFTDRDLFGIPKAPIGLLSFLQSLQEPEIAREALLERVMAKRDRIKSYVIEVSSQPVGMSNSGRSPRRYKFAADGKKRYQCEWKVPGEGQEVLWQTTSFDGQVVRQYRHQDPEQAYIYPGLVRETPSKEDFREELMGAPDNPIPFSMLIDSQAEIGYVHLDLDLVALLKGDLPVLFSERQEVDGHSCLVIGHINTVVYLDPERDDSVVRREHWILERDGDDIKSYRRGGFATFSNFQESSGVRLPTTITIEHPSSGGRHTVVTVNKLAINGGVEESLYKEVTRGVETFKVQDDGSAIPVDDK